MTAFQLGAGCNLLVGDYVTGDSGATPSADANAADVFHTDAAQTDATQTDAAQGDAALPDVGRSDRWSAAPDLRVDDGAAASLDSARPDVAALDLTVTDAAALDSRVSDSSMPDTGDAPPNPTDLVAIGGHGLVELTFTMPPVAQCSVLRRDDHFPADHTDGTLVQTTSMPGGGRVVDLDVTPDVTYFYAVFCFDAGGWNDIVVVAGNAAQAWPDYLWPHEQWARRIRLTIDNASRSEDLVDFPVLVRLDDSHIDLQQALADGTDLRFHTPGSAQWLNHEIERFDQLTGDVLVWVKVPMIVAGASDGLIHLYYDNPDALPLLAEGPSVWSNGYVAVYHGLLRASAGLHVTDSAEGGLNANLFGATAPVFTQEGIIGDGMSFDGAGIYAVTDQESPFDCTTTCTVSAWTQLGGAPAVRASMVSKGGAYALVQSIGGVIGFDVTQEDGSTSNVMSTGIAPADAAWHQVVGVAALENLYLYTDGQFDAWMAKPLPVTQTDNPLALGAISRTSVIEGYFEGLLDEVRVADVARSPDWIEAQHASMIGQLITVGAAETYTP